MNVLRPPGLLYVASILAMFRLRGSPPCSAHFQRQCPPRKQMIYRIRLTMCFCRELDHLLASDPGTVHRAAHSFWCGSPDGESRATPQESHRPDMKSMRHMILLQSWMNRADLISSSLATKDREVRSSSDHNITDLILEASFLVTRGNMLVVPALPVPATLCGRVSLSTLTQPKFYLPNLSQGVSTGIVRDWDYTCPCLPRECGRTSEPPAPPD
ncbi:hypothetical protein RRG08_017149 [Elysia crispata]|uniref:Uncharacterized protein n=1 Tax=Elysia crispata TaxID=231223 RepID=A0AAE1B1R3_9GAST|nr:hypothetical protein RRG08_017149 [Elysia crispata]